MIWNVTLKENSVLSNDINTKHQKTGGCHSYSSPEPQSKALPNYQPYSDFDIPFSSPHKPIESAYIHVCHVIILRTLN